MKKLNFAPDLSKTLTYTVLSLLTLVITLSSCDPYQQLLKSNDYDLKLRKSKEFYNEGKYVKSIPLFEELVSVYKGTKDVEDLYFFYPFAHYGSGDYLLSSYYFKRFLEYYPKSLRAEEARFMSAYSLYKLSPLSSLEQDYTQDAIDAFQLFANNYPYSEKIEECNDLIDELRAKLEEKSIASAQLYYDMQDYKAAGIAFNNLLLDFPGTEQEDRIRFTALESNFLLAENSIKTKQEERYQAAIEACEAYERKFPEGQNIKETRSILKQAKLGIELLYLEEIKSNFSLGQRSLRENKMEYFDKTFKAYETFLQKFPNSSYLRDAEKLYEQCLAQVEKLESKGLLKNLIDKAPDAKNQTTSEAQ